MSTIVVCPGCQVRVTIPEATAGQRFRCPKCRTTLPSTPSPTADPRPPSHVPASQPKQVFSHRTGTTVRRYFFKVLQAPDGTKSLSIQEVWQDGAAWKRRRVEVSEEQLPAFRDGIRAVEGFLGGSLPPATNYVENIRRQHPQAYEPWSATDDQRLLDLHRSGVPIRRLALQFQRRPSAIRSRLAKLLFGPVFDPPKAVSSAAPGAVPGVTLHQAIASLVLAMPSRLTRTSLARILTGSSAASVRRYQGHELFGRFNHVTRRAITREIDAMIHQGVIRLLDKQLLPAKAEG